MEDSFTKSFLTEDLGIPVKRVVTIFKHRTVDFLLDTHLIDSATQVSETIVQAYPESMKYSWGENGDVVLSVSNALGKSFIVKVEKGGINKSKDPNYNSQASGYLDQINEVLNYVFPSQTQQISY